MKVYRYTIPPGRKRRLTSNPNIEVDGLFALVIAESEPQARERVTAVLQEDGEPSMWLEVADVREYEIVNGTMLFRGAF